MKTAIERLTRPSIDYRNARAFLTMLLGAAAFLLSVGVSDAAAAGPQWTVHIAPAPLQFHRGEFAKLGTADHYEIEVANTGDTNTSGPVQITATLPDGLKLSAGPANLPEFECAGDGLSGVFRGASELSCGSERVFESGETLTWILPVSVFDPPDSILTHVVISGGGAPSVSVDTPTTIIDFPDFHIESFEAQTTGEGGGAFTVAGGHPSKNRTHITVPLNDEGGPQERLKDANVTLPNGFLGNPAAAPRCEMGKIPLFEFFPGQVCPKGSIVGSININGDGTQPIPLYNVKPERGHPAQFAFNFGGATRVALAVTPLPRTESYRLSVGSTDINRFEFGPGVGVTPITVVFNGVVSNETEAPFLSNPVDCSAPSSPYTLIADSWEHPGRTLFSGLPDLSDANWKTADFADPPVTGCDDEALVSQFDPTLEVRTLQEGVPEADQPTGLAVDLDFPQSNDPTDTTNTTFDRSIPQAPELRDITMDLPPGLSISPSSASGLEGCSDLASDPSGDQVHYDSTKPATCPEASKIGSVTATTPLLASHDPVSDEVNGAEPIGGQVYLLKPHPGDLSPNGGEAGVFRLLIQLDSPRYGINFKLPGNAVADPRTGRLTATFTENPQLPVKHLKVELKSGPRAPLATPTTCGTSVTTSDLVPWSSPQTPDATPSSSFAVSAGPNGTPCATSVAAQPFSPKISAGSSGDTAGATSPFILKVARADGEQQLSSVAATLPKGLSAKLAGVPACSEADIASARGKSGASEQASPSCPAASRIGSVTAGAGAGSEPYYTTGDVYLAGPYKGAPLSFAFITPAVAGPFDLGSVVVRAGAYLDSASAQVTVKTDPIPQILDGVPLRIRSLVTQIDRPDFTINPTNCAAQSVEGTFGGAGGATAHSSNPFQAAGCSKLGFKPTLKLALKGKVSRRAHPSLRATLTARPGDSNIASAQVKLPKSAFLDNAHIDGVCTRVQFAAHQCPAGSIYGKATATSPLLGYTLAGPVYLRSSSHKLPDLVVAFQGPAMQPIEIELAGKTDSVKGALRNTFEAIPDVPVTKFQLELFGGKKGLIEMSSGFCSRPTASVKFTGQNGLSYDTTPKVAAKCPKSKKGHGKGNGKGKR